MNLSEKIRLKRLVKELKSYRGRHTEFVTIYVPKGYELSKITQNLREEKQTATNIKDSKTSKAVQQAIEKMIQTLINIEKTPDNGLVVFSGNITEKENVDNYQVFWLEPPYPLNQKLYRCDQKFWVDAIEDMTISNECYGLIAMDKGEACVGVLKGSSIEVINLMTSNVPGKHKTGGQSAQRFARLREGAAVEFYKKIAQIVTTEFTFNKDLKGIIIGGPGTTKNNFFDGLYMNQEIKGKCLMPLQDITYTNDFGLKELVDKASNILKNSEMGLERGIIQEFFEILGKKPEMICYGFDKTKEALAMSAIRKLIILDNKTTDAELDELNELAENSKAEIEIITNKTPEGKQYEGLGGVGGILRFPI